MLGIGNALCEQFGNRISATATEPFPEVYGRKNEPHFGCCLSDRMGYKVIGNVPRALAPPDATSIRGAVCM